MNEDIDKKIEEILREEKTQKQSEYNNGIIYLTENHLIWQRKKKPDSLIIPLEEIKKAKEATRLGRGTFLKIVFGPEEKKAYLPLSKGRLNTPQLDDIQGWVTTLTTGTASNVFQNIIYAGGHAAYAKKHNGKLILTSTTLIFQEKKGKLNLEIPLAKIKNIGIKTASEISRLSTFVVGPLWSMGFPMKSKFVIIEYEDEIGMKQMPLFDFPLDRGDKHKGEVMQAIYAQLKKIKATAK